MLNLLTVRQIYSYAASVHALLAAALYHALAAVSHAPVAHTVL
jgi:hypothetical protein